MENLNELLVELEEFNRVTTITTTTSDDEQPIPQNLENLIEYVARTGKYIFPWPKIRKLFVLKLKNVLAKLVTLMPASTNMTANTNNNNAMLNSSFYNAANEASTSLNENSNNTSMNMSPGETLKEIKDRIVERMESFTSAPFTIQRISELLLKPSIHYKQLDKFLRGLEKCVMVVTTVDPNGNKIFIESIVPETNVTSSRQLAATPRMPTPFLSRVDDTTTTTVVSNNLLSSSPPPSSTTNPQLETTPVNNNNNNAHHETSSLSSPSSSSSSSLETTAEQEEPKPSENLIATSTELIMVTTETHDNANNKPIEVTDLSAISVAMTTGSGGTHEEDNIVTDQVNVRVVSDQETGETTTTTTTTISSTSVEATDEKMTTEPSVTNEDETEQMDHSGTNLPVESSDLETTVAVTKTSEETKTSIVNGGTCEVEGDESIAVETTTTTTVLITPETPNT